MEEQIFPPNALARQALQSFEIIKQTGANTPEFLLVKYQTEFNT
jgi:hypothetical protein